MIRAYTLAACVVAVLGGLALVWREGRNAAMDDINRQNERAQNETLQSDLGYLACTAVDGLFWDFATGECRGAAPSGR